MRKSVPWHILWHVSGFLFFLVLLAIGNFLIPFVNSSIYANVIRFLNANVLLFLVMMVIGIVNEVFWSLYFPLNILAPLASAILSIFIITFFHRVWIFVNSYVHSNVSLVIAPFYVIVFLIVLVAGYITILARHGKPRNVWEEEHGRWHEWGMRHMRRKTKVEWEDVGDEFRLALYNLGKNINEALAGPRKPKRK